MVTSLERVPASPDADRSAADRALDLVAAVRKPFRERDELYKYIWDVVYGRVSTRIPKGYRKLGTARRNPLAVYYTNTITAALTVNGPAVLFPIVGIGEAAQTNATQREHFFDAAWERQEEEAEAPIFRRFTHSVVCLGEGVLKTVPRSRTAWADYTRYSKDLQGRLEDGDLRKLDTDSKDRLYNAKTEEYKKTVAPYPIRSTDVPPETFYSWRGEDGMTLAVEHKRVPYLETLVKYGQALDRQGRIVSQGAAEALPADDWSSAMEGLTHLTMDEVWTWDKCFPAETLVSSGARVLAVSRRWYSGPLVEITTAGGKKLAGTPNHPVLTDRGWVGLGDLAVGDRVVRGPRLDQRPAGHQHDQHVQATIGQVFDFANERRAAEVRRGTEHDFHGDGQDADVHVVPIDRELWDGFNAAFAQPVCQQSLTVADDLVPGTLLRQGGGAQPVGVGGFATGGGVRGGDAGGPLLGAVPGVDDTLPLGYRAEGDAGASQAPINVPLARADAAGDLRRRETVLDVETDEVVASETRAFDGYVHNLHTETERYIANGFVVHNCVYLASGPGQYTAQSGDKGSLLRQFRHRYGDPITKSLRGPYAHCYGTTTASRLPEHAGLGVLYGFLDLFVMLDELLTIQQINSVITGLASFKRNSPPPGTGSGGLPESHYGEDGLPVPREPETIEPGKIFPHDIGPIEMPRAGAALPETIAQTKEFIELILPKVLQGVVDTTDSGYQLALAARLGRIAFDPMVSNIRRAAARRVGFESWLIENEIGETVYAWGTPPRNARKKGRAEAGVLSIGPDDLKGIHRYKIRLEPEDKATELVEVRKHREMVDGKFEDISDAREALGLNHEEIEMKIALTTMKADPEIVAQLRTRVLQKIALRTQQQEENAQAALAPMDQAAPDPGAALQGMGNVHEGGQEGMPFEPGVPGATPGLPAVPPGAPPGVPPQGMQVNPNPAMGGIGVV